jgi:hypothetical protein
LRDRVTATIDSALKEEQVRATIVLKDGTRLDKFIDHVVGSVERPMTDADLERKFLGLAEGVLPERPTADGARAFPQDPPLSHPRSSAADPVGDHLRLRPHRHQDAHCGPVGEYHNRLQSSTDTKTDGTWR